MKLTLKFNLIFVAIFGLGLAATGYIANRFLQNHARDEVVQQARLMMETSSSSRAYTSHQVRPILEKIHSRENVFYPESVPAFAALSVFNYLRKTYPDYAYREATLNPTNPRDRATDWEADIIRNFADRPETDKSLIDGERDTPTGRSVYLAAPLRSPASCLECHSTPEAAPKAMLALYGPANGFGWKENQVIGAQIVSVPVTLPEKMAAQTFRHFMISLSAVGIVTLLVLNVLLYITVIRPVRRFATSADRISQGDMDVPELPARGRDEISILAGAFNRMHRSLASAMKMLDEK